MEKLSPFIRQAMVKSARDCTVKTNKWSLQSLAALNANCSNQNSMGNKERRQVPPSHVAETLLEEVMYRLASQHAKCMEMVQQVSGEKTKSMTDRFPISSTSKKVVKALNQPVGLGSMGDWIAQKKVIEKEHKDALSGLRGLEVLHANTFELVGELMSNERPVIKRFEQADKDLIAATFEQIRSRHASTVETLADTVISLRRVHSSSHNLGIMEAQHYAHSAIDSNLVMQFLRDRLGIQLFCDHYVALNKGKPGGGISVSSDFTDVLTDAVLESKHVCDANLGTAPDVHVLDSDLSPDQMHLTFVKPWVHHALVELLKNGMASSVQKAIDTGLEIPVPDLYIKVTSNGESDDSLVCHVLDQGVGLEKESPREAFEFAKSSSLKRWDRIDEQQSYAMVRAPLGSLGVGLPMSQIMMQSFGGDIHLQNRECGHMHKEIGTPLGSGCTSSLILPRDDAIRGI